MGNGFPVGRCCIGAERFAATKCRRIALRLSRTIAASVALGGGERAEKLKLGKLKAEMGLGDIETTDHRTKGGKLKL